ncbi:hypothetical protein BHE90_015367, partial [Fusarium euwallaceae]
MVKLAGLSMLLSLRRRSSQQDLGGVESTENALLTIHNNQKSDGSLPKAGPPYPTADSD